MKQSTLSQIVSSVSVVVMAAMLAGCEKGTPPATGSRSHSKEPVVVVAEANEVDGSDPTEIELTRKLEEKRRANGGKPKAKNNAGTKSATVATPTPPAPQAPGPGEQRCFECDGQGQVTCVAPGCRSGYLTCPGRCLKRNQGTWVPDTAHGGMAAKIKVPGGGTWTINEGHAGEVWVAQGGKMVSQGPCPTCGGRQVIRCKTCDATGKTACELCEAKGAIPATWKPTDNPWFNRNPDLVRLQDGRAFLAKEVGGDDVVVMFKTRTGEVITIARAEVTQGPKKP
ncbi:MAG: hypothetical protein JNL10_13665 [Verrucomicrobiales bacterium]|nr:hypothetical protein [Verrucomicrobiales bacterium]